MPVDTQQAGTSGQGTTVSTSDGSAVRAALARLPESVIADLREAFADEVSERLPRLRAAAESLDPKLLEQALRDVHTLGSSAYVVGEDEAARTARAAEAVLVDDGPAEMFAGLVADLDKRLCAWER